MTNNDVMIILRAPAGALARVRARQAEYNMLMDMATSMGGGGQTVKIDGEMHLVEKVSGSRSVSDPMAEKTCRAADVKSDLKAAVDEWKKAVARAQALLAPLPPRQYGVINELFIQDHTLREAADNLGISYSTALSEKKKALATLVQ